MCIACGKELKHGKLFCSIPCQNDYHYRRYIDSWLSGDVTGHRGINIKTYSNHVIRYIRERAGNKCERCGWNKIHPLTGKSPLHIHHIDGDAENNSPTNLEVVCPNCHALTENFGGANRGNGRKDRRAKYRKQI